MEIASSWTPSAGENEPKNVPMHLGSRAGGAERLCQLFFVSGDVRAPLERFRSYTQAIEQAGLARVQLAAPLLRTLPGTDRHVDELW